MEEIILNIKDFNAIGDGSTDNTQAFQNAINTIKITKTAKATIYVPEGIYKVKYIGVASGKCGFTTLSQYLYFGIDRVNPIDTL
ncbi:glycosyl hydrolase family 28-related protein [Clostridium perfringens]|nr:glycosyl hydrolase family 28-related protein [Clostridium perfringens]